MLLGENITLALSSIRANKMRAFLTMLGIIIGIGSVIAILTVGHSLTLTVEDNMQAMGSKDIYVGVVSRIDSGEDADTIDGVEYPTSESGRDMSESDYITTEMIHDMCDKFADEIYAVNVYDQTGSGTASYGMMDADISVTGVSAGYFVTNSIDILAGRMLSEADFGGVRNVCLIDKKLVEELFEGDDESSLGKEVEFHLDGVKTTTFTVVGVYESASSATPGGMSQLMELIMPGAKIYIPLPASNRLTGDKDHIMALRVSAKVGVDSQDLAASLTNFYEPYFASNPDYEVTAITLEGMLESLASIVDKIALAISIIAGIALLVGGIGVMNIMLVSVTERTREIGTRKALGARNSSIRIQFLIEAMIICLIGGVIGLVLGLVGGSLASNLLGYPATPPLGGVVFSLLFSIGIGLAFGYFPADKAAKMNPIDALRYE